MKKNKKLLALPLLLLSCLSLSSCNNNSGGDTKEESEQVKEFRAFARVFNYTQDSGPDGIRASLDKDDMGSTDDTITITGFLNPDEVTEITVPESVRGLKITGLGSSAFANNESLTKIVLPDTIETISENALTNLSQLTDLTLPTKTIVSPNAIDGTPYLLNKYVKAEGETGINLVNNNSIYSVDKKKLATLGNAEIPGNVTFIPNEMFKDCEITSVTIPSSITKIGEYAFRNTKLESVTLPKTVKEVGDSAFSNITTLKSFYTFDVTDIENSPKTYEPIELGSTILSGSYENLESLSYPGETTLEDVLGSISSTAKEKLKLTNVYLNGEHIAKRALQNFSSIKTLKLANSVILVDDYAFEGVNQVTEFYPNGENRDSSLSYIGNHYITEDKVISHLLTSSSYNLQMYADDSTWELIELNTEGDIVKASGTYSSNENDTLTLTVTTNTDNILKETTYTTIVSSNKHSLTLTLQISKEGSTEKEDKEITLNETTLKHGLFSSPWYTSYRNSLGNDSYMILGSALFNKVGNPDLSSLASKSIKGYADEIFKGLTTVNEEFAHNTLNINEAHVFGKNSFEGTKIASIDASDSSYWVYNEAFKDVDTLKSVKLSENTTISNQSPFGNNYQIEELSGPFNNLSMRQLVGDTKNNNCALKKVELSENVTTIASSAFFNCKKLESITFHDGLKTIGASSFSMTNIKEVYIPYSVTLIGANAFAFCESLNKVTIEDVKVESEDDPNGTEFNNENSHSAVNGMSNRLTINGSVFFGCKSLTGTFIIPFRIYEIGSSCFVNTAIEHLEIRLCDKDRLNKPCEGFNPTTDTTSAISFALGFEQKSTYVVQGDNPEYIDYTVVGEGYSFSNK